MFIYFQSLTAVICLVLGTASGLPQQPPGLKQVFSTLSDGQQQGEVDNNEQVPYTSIQNFTEGELTFELREYPSVKWVCTESTYNMTDETIPGLDGVSPTDELGAIKWMKEMQSSKTWKDRPSSKMFMKMFRYISGVNKEREEVEMTVPVLNTKTVLEGGKIKTKMCFYIEAKWQENPPTPEDPAVFIESSTPMKVYVQKFGGYAMTDSVWTKAANDFSKQMGDRFNEVNSDYFLTASYDSPMKFWNRRNEVMFQLKEANGTK